MAAAEADDEAPVAGRLDLRDVDRPLRVLAVGHARRREHDAVGEDHHAVEAFHGPRRGLVLRRREVVDEGDGRAAEALEVVERVDLGLEDVLGRPARVGRDEAPGPAAGDGDAPPVEERRRRRGRERLAAVRGEAPQARQRRQRGDEAVVEKVAAGQVDVRERRAVARERVERAARAARRAQVEPPPRAAGDVAPGPVRGLYREEVRLAGDPGQDEPNRRLVDGEAARRPALSFRRCHRAR